MINTFPINTAVLSWLELILTERFGHAWQLKSIGNSLDLSLEGADGAIIFDTLQVGFTKSHSNQSFTSWDAKCEGWHSVLDEVLPAPGVTELPTPLIESCADGYVIHYDILGLTYWMLTRLEEIGRTDLDSHERFPASSSHAYKHGYLDRPVVDEWLYVLGQVIERQWPNIELKQHEFEIRVSHDVDIPSLCAFKPWKTIALKMVKDILKRRDTKAFFTAPYVKLATSDSLTEADPYNTFDFLMDVSESNGLKSAFYFICGRTDPSKDAYYEIEHSVMRDLLRRIYNRGHEIGLHPSYNTFRDKALIGYEADRLKRICAEEGISQKEWGGRMHYLRWEQPTTMIAWADAGMNYDSTLGYADHAGFRCGTCHEYPAFDATRQKQLNLRIRPLIAMDCSVVSEGYMGLGIGAESEIIFNRLKSSCYKVQGCFTLLWHNSYFEIDGSKSFYNNIVSSSS